MRSRRNPTLAARRDDVSLLAQLIHDLKNPLGIVLGYAEAMTLTDGAEQAELSARLMINARAVLEVLDEYALLEGLRHKQVSLDRGDCSWQVVTNRVITAFGETAREREQQIATRPDEAVTIHADPQRFEQMIRLLVREALRATPRGARLALVAEPAADAVELRLEIAAEPVDAPPSPPPDLVIFDPQRPAIELVARLAALHRGSLSFASTPERAVATLRLAAAPKRGRGRREPST